MKFYCQDCGKLYQKCNCVVYMSAYRLGVTRLLPEDTKRGKTSPRASVDPGQAPLVWRDWASAGDEQ